MGKNSTSDVNLASYMTYKGLKLVGTSTTYENGRVRVWFDFESTEEEFDNHKNSFFSQNEESKVIAQRLFQERERIYSLMIQARNSHKK